MQILIPLIIFFLIICIIVVLPTVIIQIHLRKLRQEDGQIKVVRAKMESAVWAGATIVSTSCQNLGDSMRTVARVELHLEVNSPAGEKYQATTTWLVSVALLPQLQPGQTISVKIDARNPRTIYPNMQGAEYYYWS